LHYHPHSEESLLALVHNNPHIESLSLIGLGVTDYFYAELARSCTCLLDLSLAGAHAELQSLEILWQGCSTLRMLTFLQCNLYSHQPKTVCDSLRELVLNDSSIDDKTLRELLRVCPGLTVLQLTDCDELLRLHDLPLGELCPNLRTLKLVGNGSCAGEVLLRSVGAHCTELRELDIPAAPAAKDAGLCAIAGGCRHLHQLNLIDCVNVANKTLLAVAAYCAELEILTLRGCKKVTDKGVKAVMKGCPKLVEFSVAHCYRLSTKVEIAVSERYENDDYLHAWSC
jgi:F-box/leucine-rich repeat protein 2/20